LALLQQWAFFNGNGGTADAEDGGQSLVRADLEGHACARLRIEPGQDRLGRMAETCGPDGRRDGETVERNEVLLRVDNSIRAAIDGMRADGTRGKCRVWYRLRADARAIGIGIS
jgi:hypothetical protein